MGLGVRTELIYQKPHDWVPEGGLFVGGEMDYYLKDKPLRVSVCLIEWVTRVPSERTSVNHSKE